MFIELIVVSALGSGLGSQIRYAVSREPRFYKLFGFSLATILINIFGSFCLGFIANANLPIIWKTFLGSGVIGGFTTFSTFILEISNLTVKKNKVYAILYLFISVTFSLIAFLSGKFLILLMIGG